jgi:hypothetical protein
LWRGKDGWVWCLIFAFERFTIDPDRLVERVGSDGSLPLGGEGAKVRWKLRMFSVCDRLPDDVAGVDELWGVERRLVFDCGISKDHLGGRWAHSTNLL